MRARIWRGAAGESRARASGCPLDVRRWRSTRSSSRLTSGRSLDWSEVTTFNLDEFVGLGPDDPAPIGGSWSEHLFRHTNLDPRRINFLLGTADPEAECPRYERAIADAGGIDIQILGIGTNGHIGFNEPAPVLEARTHRVTLTARDAPQQRGALRRKRRSGARPRRCRWEWRRSCRRAALILLANGESKAGCIAELVNGPLTTELPASFLQLHPDVDLILDSGRERAKPRS